MNEKRIKLYAFLFFVLGVILITSFNLIIHELIHFYQAGCEGNPFNRIHFGDIPNRDTNWWNSALAYTNVGGCETPQNANEYVPYAVNTILTFVLGFLYGIFVFLFLEKKDLGGKN